MAAFGQKRTKGQPDPGKGLGHDRPWRFRQLQSRWLQAARRSPATGSGLNQPMVLSVGGRSGVYAHDDAFKWLALAAITPGILTSLGEHRQRTCVGVQIRATTAPVGETITWNDGSAPGTVKTLRGGTSSPGRYCQKVRQAVPSAGAPNRRRQPGGAWQVMSSGQSQ